MFPIWVGLEINLLSFIGILTLTKPGRVDRRTFKYFVRQALGSIIMIISFLLMARLIPITVGIVLFRRRVIIKLGLFPFHPWFISFTAASSLKEVWAVSVPQKILPFWFCLRVPLNYHLILGSAILGIFTSMLGGLKSARLTLILGYSSLLNTRWFILFILDLSLFAFVFALYGISLGLVVSRWDRRDNSSLFSQLAARQTWLRMLTLVVRFLNLGGLPPFINMWNKFLILLELFLGGSLVILGLFVISSGVFLYIYLSVRFWESSLCRGRKLNWTTTSGPIHVIILLAGSLMLFYF